MNIEALFLDVGQTLLREKSSRAAIYARAAERWGGGVSAERMHEHMREVHTELGPVFEGHFRYSDPWFEAFIARIFGTRLGLPSAAVEAVTEELFARFEDPRTFELYPGLEELLCAAREAGLRLGIVSNWSARLPHLLRACNLADRFDFVLSSAIEGLEKPDPALFQRALERAGVAADCAVHAGDHLRNDLDAAQEVGIEAVWVDHGGALASTGKAPPAGVRTVTNLSELRSFILSRL